MSKQKVMKVRRKSLRWMMRRKMISILMVKETMMIMMMTMQPRKKSYIHTDAEKMYLRCMDGDRYIYARPGNKNEEVTYGMKFCEALIFSEMRMHEAAARDDWCDFSTLASKWIFPAVFPDNKDILEGIIQMGFALHERCQAIPKTMVPPVTDAFAEEHKQRTDLFKKDFLSFKQRCTRGGARATCFVRCGTPTCKILNHRLDVDGTYTQ
jgi:hypothetical protein